MIKFYAPAALVVALLLAGWQLESQRSQINQLTTLNKTLEDNVESLKEQSQFEQSQIALQNDRYRRVNDELVESEASLTYLRGIFNRHDFGKLLSKKPQLITNRMIKGTEKVLQELEDASK